MHQIQAKMSAAAAAASFALAILCGASGPPAKAQHPPAPATQRQAPAPKKASADPGAEIYKTQCAACHMENRAGSPPEYPSLIGVSKRFNDQELTDAITGGLPKMVAFPDLTPEQVAALIKFLKTADDPPSKK